MKRLLLIVLATICIAGLVSCSDVKVDPVTYEYEVISVYPYIKTTTTIRGGITSQDVRYNINYIDNNGNIKCLQDFYNTEHGLYKLHIGDSNKIVFKEQGMDTYVTVYLTRETYGKLYLGQG